MKKLTKKKEQWMFFLYSSIDGIGLANHSNNSGYRSRWISDSNFIRLSGREFLGATHVRLNCLYTKERATRGRITPKGRNCPGYSVKRESLAHILQVCGRSKNQRTFRHNVIVNGVINKLRKLGHQIKREPRIPVKNSFVKPDIVAFNKETKRVLIADPLIVAVSRDLEKAERDKQIKYNTPEVVKWIKAKYGKETSVEVCGLILD